MSASRRRRSVIGPVIDRFIDLKHALGRGYRNESRVLDSIDTFLSTRRTKHPDLTPEAFRSWCNTLLRLTSGVRRYRMRVVRNFCLYRRRTNPGCFVPDQAEFPPLHQPVQPHIFSEKEISALLRASTGLKATPDAPLRPEVFRLAIVLLYTTGMRRGELLHMTIGDYDHHDGTLIIRATKFHKSRLVPLSHDGIRVLKDYLRARRLHRLPVSLETPLIWNNRTGGKGYTAGGLRDGMRRLLLAAGIRRPDGQLPRVHDFRHSFAVQALLRWYRSGSDVQAKLPLLATYMGHVSIVSTEYYLRFIDSVAGFASERFARRCGALVTTNPEER